jgi:fumarylacetoacetase
MSTKSWLPIPANSPFSLANIPFGIVSTANNPKLRLAVAIGEHVLDLSAFASNNGFSKLGLDLKLAVFSSSTLNDFAALGQAVHVPIRKYLQDVFRQNSLYPELLKDNSKAKDAALIHLKDVQNHLPMQIGDYTDFYAGLNHAYNVGVLFRGPENALQPNYTHLPVGYHGRASSIVVSGTPVRRPKGQIVIDLSAASKIPTFSASKKLDIEVELGAFITKSNDLGEPVSISEAKTHIFGYVLVNDWSARDIQAWEYVPLGPFNGKNFGTTISPWVVLADALDPFLVKPMDNPSEILPYLRESVAESLPEIKLEVELTSKSYSSYNLSTA